MKYPNNILDLYVQLIINNENSPEDAIKILKQGCEAFFSETHTGVDIYTSIKNKYGIQLCKDDVFRSGNMGTIAKAQIRFNKLLYFIEERDSLKLKQILKSDKNVFNIVRNAEQLLLTNFLNIITESDKRFLKINLEDYDYIQLYEPTVKFLIEISKKHYAIDSETKVNFSAFQQYFKITESQLNQISQTLLQPEMFKTYKVTNNSLDIDLDFRKVLNLHKIGEGKSLIGINAPWSIIEPEESILRAIINTTCRVFFDLGAKPLKNSEIFRLRESLDRDGISLNYWMSLLSRVLQVDLNYVKIIEKLVPIVKYTGNTYLLGAFNENQNILTNN